MNVTLDRVHLLHLLKGVGVPGYPDASWGHLVVDKGNQWNPDFQWDDTKLRTLSNAELWNLYNEVRTA